MSLIISLPRFLRNEYNSQEYLRQLAAQEAHRRLRQTIIKSVMCGSVLACLVCYAVISRQQAYADIINKCPGGVYGDICVKKVKLVKITLED
jgi:hypothetical protein